MKGKIRPAVSLLAVMLIMTGTAGTQSAAAASSQRIDSASTEKQADRYAAAEDTHALPHYRPQLRWESAERAKNVPEALSKGQNTRVDKALTKQYRLLLLRRMWMRSESKKGRR